ncbi:S-adenosyl-L-methionine-dependent methyltransferase [Martensiomyces pterosporus]|nr:S-adenosyl-L-methionine-dependent methyltransferase [Martensiomyces pterosporus]
MLSRQESVTGWIAVSDEVERDLRLLRSGHSIIGGHWNSTTESIFGVFYYPDAVRLLARNALIGDGSERALQIGLGIGVSARSLHEQNVRVDVVEIDPAVYKAATEYFFLPKNLNGVHLQDGRQFIDEAPASTYDYIVHDVFTGGSVPSSLFSQSAVAQLKRILKPDGVLAMNYVGVPSDTRTLHHVAHTIRTAFPHVRCFAETTGDLDTMTNMMFFASPEPVEFDISRDVIEAMGRDSIRARMLVDMEKKEIRTDGYNAEDVRPITDDWNPLPEWQVDTAIQHWKAMREMFPSEYWLNY